MMHEILQLSTTYLVLVLATLAAYIVYLQTSQSSIDAELQRLGAASKQSVRDAHVLDAPIPYIDFVLLHEYRKQYHEDSDLALLGRIATELYMANLPWPEEMVRAAPGGMLGVAAKADPRPNLRGRLGLWLIQQSLAALVGKRELTGFAAFTVGQPVKVPFDSGTLIFPDGPLAADAWLERAQLAVGTIGVLTDSFAREVVLGDMADFVTTEHGRHLQAYDFRAWWDRVEALRLSVAEQAGHVTRFARLRDSFAIESRLPSLRAVLGWCGGLLLAGILAPLTVIGLGWENCLPPSVGLAAAVVVLALTVWVGRLISQDITAKTSTVEVRHLRPLLEDLRTMREQGRAKVGFGLQLMNEALSDKSRDGLPEDDRDVIERLQRAVIKSNAASEGLIEHVREPLNSLKKPREGGSGGFSGMALPPLVLIESGATGNVAAGAPGVSIEASIGQVSSILLQLALPADGAARAALFRELDAVAAKARALPEFAAYVDARVSLEQELQSAENHLSIRLQVGRRRP